MEHEDDAPGIASGADDERAGWERGAIYCRASSLEHSSLDVQVLENLAWAEAHRVRVEPNDIYIDYGSGVQPELPGLSALRARLRTGVIDRVVFISLPTLSREVAGLHDVLRDLNSSSRA